MGNKSWILRCSANLFPVFTRIIAGAILTTAILLCPAQPHLISAQTAPQAKSTGSTGCHVESIDYKGWKAQQISNRWVRLAIVPQNGGRLMQVTFNGHAYLFVNPKLAGKYRSEEHTSELQSRVDLV